MELWTASRTTSSNANTATDMVTVSAPGPVAEGDPESLRQSSDCLAAGGDVRRKVQSQPEDGEGAGLGVGETSKAEGGGRKKGVLEGGLFLGRKRAPPVPHLSSLPTSSSAGSEGGGSDSSASASPSLTKLASSTSPRHRRPASEPSNQDSIL